MRSRLLLHRIPIWITKRPLLKSAEIPFLIHQTYFSKDRIPPKVAQNFSKFAPAYERRVYDDADIELFMSTHFHPDVLTKFKSLKKGAHKADLFRYCVLYVDGGIYMDIKTELVMPIEVLFPHGVVSTVVSRNPQEIYQGIIAAPPRQPIFLSLIEGIVRSSRNPPYNLFIREFMRYIKNDVSSTVKEGLFKGKLHSYKLLTETCTSKAEDCEDGLDRYKFCCNVTSNAARVVKTRYSDYPW